MNRAERRKAKKAGIIKEKHGEKIYKFNQHQLDNFVTEILMQQRKETVERITAEFISLMFLTCTEVLNSQFGFGELRLKRFKYHVEDLCDSIEKGYVTLDDIEGDLAEKMNLDFLRNNVKMNEIYSRKYFDEMEVVNPYPEEVISEDEEEGIKENE